MKGAKRLVLVATMVERYYVTDEAVSAVFALPRMIEGEGDRDDALIELFEQHEGSVYCDRLFSHDANPSVWCELIEEDEGD